MSLRGEAPARGDFESFKNDLPGRLTGFENETAVELRNEEGGGEGVPRRWIAVPRFGALSFSRRGTNGRKGSLTSGGLDGREGPDWPVAPVVLDHRQNCRQDHVLSPCRWE